MEWLNYHHLYYFSIITREGGLAPAARKLRLTHSTLSAQLRALEHHFGSQLFERRGKRLVLTPFGADVASYAEDIFRLGHELNDMARGRTSPGRGDLRVGVLATLPKTLVYHLLSPALALIDQGCVDVRQSSLPELIESLLAGRLHLVISDEVPILPSGQKVHAHSLGETAILLYATPALARQFGSRFPASLAGAPFVLPPNGTRLRRKLEDWLVANKLSVHIRAEIGDAGLLRVFGEAGSGIFPVRDALSAEVEDLHDVQELGPCAGVREEYFVLSLQRRITHPAASVLIESARLGLHAPIAPKRTSKTRRLTGAKRRGDD
jgi:LysR family transcriptional activator of nhaA